MSEMHHEHVSGWLPIRAVLSVKFRSSGFLGHKLCCIVLIAQSTNSEFVLQGYEEKAHRRTLARLWFGEKGGPPIVHGVLFGQARTVAHITVYMAVHMFSAGVLHDYATFIHLYFARACFSYFHIFRFALHVLSLIHI